MKNTSSCCCIHRGFIASALIIMLGAWGAPRALGTPSGGAPADLAPAAKLDGKDAQALVEAYAEKKKMDFSRFESGRVQMERRKDGRIYWSVSYKRIVRKDEPLALPGTDSRFFTVDDETKEVRLILGY